MTRSFLASFLISLTALSGPAIASVDLETAYLHRLNRAKPGEIAGVRREFEQLRVLRLACKLQMKEKKVPVSCYQALATEARWDLRPALRTRSLRAELDRHCARAALALRVPPHETDLAAVSPPCARQIQEAWRIQAYRQEGRRWLEN